MAHERRRGQEDSGVEEAPLPREHFETQDAPEVPISLEIDVLRHDQIARIELIQSLRRRIANGSYRVPARSLADSMLESMWWLEGCESGYSA